MSMSQSTGQDMKLKINESSMSNICATWKWNTLTSMSIVDGPEKSLHNDF